MIITVHPKWRVKSDPHGWHIEHHTRHQINKETGATEPRWDFVASYGSIESAMKNIFERGIRRIDSSVPEEIVREVKEFRQIVDKALEAYRIL